MGCSVAVDGEWAIVGSCGDSKFSGLSGAGAAYYLNVNDNGIHLVLTSPDPSQLAHFGSAVALLRVGTTTTVLIGAEGATANGAPFVGAAYLFTISHLPAPAGMSQRFSRKLIASDGMDYDHVGCAVAMHGGRALVGARGPDSPMGGRAASRVNGGVYVFDMASGSQIAKLVPSSVDGPTCLWFGASLAVTDQVILIGAPYARSPCAGRGRGPRSGTVFTFDTSSLTQREKLNPADGTTGDNFGRAVAAYDIPGGISQLFVGSPRAAVALGMNNIGAVYRIEHLNGMTTSPWPSRTLGPTDRRSIMGGGAEFGSALSADGHSGLVLVGAIRTSGPKGLRSGSAELIRFPAGTTPTLANVDAGNRTFWGVDSNPEDAFGSAVALNGAGVAIVASGNHDHKYASGAGGLYVYQPTILVPPPATPPVYVPPPSPLSPGSATVPTVVFEAVVSGSIDTFSQDAYKGRLANFLSIHAKQIALLVTPASVRVVASIRMEDTQTADAIASVLGALNVTAATDALGVQVESMQPPVVTFVIIPAPSPPPGGQGAAVDVAFVVGMVALIMVAFFATLLFYVTFFPMWHHYMERRAEVLRKLQAGRKVTKESASTVGIVRRIEPPKKPRSREETIRDDAKQAWNALTLGHGKVHISLLKPLLTQYFEANPQHINLEPDRRKLRDPMPMRAATAAMTELLQDGNRHWTREDYASWCVKLTVSRGGACSGGREGMELVVYDLENAGTSQTLASVEKKSAGTQYESPKSAWATAVDRPSTPQFAKKFKAEADASWEAFQAKRARTQAKRVALKVGAFAIKCKQMQRATAPPVLPNSPSFGSLAAFGGQQQIEDRLPRSLLPPPSLLQEDARGGVVTNII
jgi:hypothetical protein